MVFFYPEQRVSFCFFSIRATSHEILHRPQFTVLRKLVLFGLAPHAPVPGHRLFPQYHGLECQVARDEDFGDGCVGWHCGWVLNLVRATKLSDERATRVLKQV